MDSSGVCDLLCVAEQLIFINIAFEMKGYLNVNYGCVINVTEQEECFPI